MRIGNTTPPFQSAAATARLHWRPAVDDPHLLTGQPCYETVETETPSLTGGVEQNYQLKVGANKQVYISQVDAAVRFEVLVSKRRSYAKQRRSLPKLDGRSREKLVKVCEYVFEAALNAQETIDHGSRSSHSDSTH